ncbi:hypothetical protein ACFL04_04535 [Patescibacteria group bacterium]
MKIHCPKCKSTKVLPIVYGLPAPELEKQASEGKVFLAGCVMYENNPKYHCDKCGEEWR